MGEAWSDWYAADYLVAQGLELDAHGDGGPRRGRVRGRRRALIRTRRMDCPVGSRAACPVPAGAGTGGYTFGDFGNVIGFPRCTPTARSGRRRCGTCAGR